MLLAEFPNLLIKPDPLPLFTPDSKQNKGSNNLARGCAPRFGANQCNPLCDSDSQRDSPLPFCIISHASSSLCFLSSGFRLRYSFSSISRPALRSVSCETIQLTFPYCFNLIPNEILTFSPL